MGNQNNEKKYMKEYVPIWLIIVVLSVDILLLVVWLYGALHWKNAKIIGDLPSMIGSIVAFSVAVFGVNVTRAGIFNKGGTPYYGKAVSKRSIKKIMKDDVFLKKYKDQDKFNEVCVTIEELQKTYPKDNETSLYWKYVFFLQESNLNFKKIWNNNEYFSANNRMSEKQIEYTYYLTKYIYVHVYEVNETAYELFH